MYHDVDGIFSEDIIAYACLQNAKRFNIDVPRDLKIIGYDGNDILKLSLCNMWFVVPYFLYYFYKGKVYSCCRE